MVDTNYSYNPDDEMKEAFLNYMDAVAIVVGEYNAHVNRIEDGVESLLELFKMARPATIRKGYRIRLAKLYARNVKAMTLGSMGLEKWSKILDLQIEMMACLDFSKTIWGAEFAEKTCEAMNGLRKVLEKEGL